MRKCCRRPQLFFRGSSTDKFVQFLEKMPKKQIEDQTKEEQDKLEVEQEQISLFVRFSNQIKAIINNLNELNQYGYPKDAQRIGKREYKCSRGKFTDLVADEKEINMILEEWKCFVIKAYQDNYCLTFLNTEVLWIVEKYFLRQLNSFDDTKTAENWLAYMRKSVNKVDQFEQFYIDINQISPLEKSKARLNRLCAMLDTLEYRKDFETNPGIVQKIKPNIVIQKNEVLYLETHKSFIGIVSVYINSGRLFPRADQLLFCNENTTWQEIQCFVYRCIKNISKELHCIIKPESLSLDNQNSLTLLIQKVMKEEMPYNHFYFGIITCDSKQHVSSFMRCQEYTKFVRDQHFLTDEKIKQVINQIDQTTTFVYSAQAGLGKTHFIKRMGRDIGLEVLIFPISGVINFGELGKRLAALDTYKESILAIQIGFVDRMDLLNEFLINICLFRVFQSGKNIFIVPQNWMIYIELQNTFDNMFENQIIYRQYVNQHYISFFDLDALEVNVLGNPELDQLQYVCNILSRLNDPQIEFDNIVQLDQRQCIQLLNEHFVQGQNKHDQDPNYIQLSVFLKILHTQLLNFQNSPLTQEILNDLGMKDLRVNIVKAMLLSIEEFTIKSITRRMRNVQNSAYSQVNRNESNQMMMIQEEEKKDEGEQNNLEDLDNQFQIKISWESQNHFSIIVVEDGTPTFIYKNPDIIPADMKNLIKSQSQLLQQQQDAQIEDLSNLDDGQLQQKLQLFRTHLPDAGAGLKNQDYVVTTDNFLKMCIIYMRVQSKVPVIIMGETGCGKTSLIRFFSENIRNDKLRIFNIHAGITTQIIIDQMTEFIHEAYAQEHKNVWVFFDEFNTTENLSLICEILTERTLLGEPIPENMRLLAACNPYKLKSRKIKFDENVGIKRSNALSRKAQNMLLYTVQPLPDNIIEYVWDFGALSNLDYQKYIKQMLTNAKVKSIDMMTSILLECHKYFKANEDSSSVSLRDVSRFIILYKWFRESLQNKKALSQQYGKSESYQENMMKNGLLIPDYRIMNDNEIDLRASLLAFTHCYFLRISSLRERINFLDKVCTAQTQMREVDTQYILECVNSEQNDYIARMELPDGTAINQALKENIFAMIPCIVNKIPIFICGKPGCSKSLAITLVFANLRGEKSVDRYFKTLPELTMVSFQGSDSCTSDGILKAYERAKKYLKTDASNLLPVFVFDEIGLAELSKHNPLKVLHSLLEVENKVIGFIGISNWRLDASKMNRALYLARPDPDEDDLKFTAMCIYSQICPKLDAHKQVIENLASSYFDLKNYFKWEKPDYADFYGLRDFYHLIKQISRSIARKNIDSLEALLTEVKIAIARNFGGKLEAAEKFGEFFAKRQKIEDMYPDIPTPSVLELIQMNLDDKDSRYLMLICRSDVANFLLEKNFKNHIRQRRTLVGSNLPNDQKKEEYGFRSLSDIILYVEKGISVILKDMDHIYSSLYDLFNQNFAVYADKRYCRIALGALLNPKCFVHDDFHSIIFMNDDDESLKKADAPFLNRFEKHYIDLESLLTNHQRQVVDELKGWIDELLTPRFDARNLLLFPTNIFPNYSSDTLGLLVQTIFDELPPEEEFDLERTVLRCKVKLISFATQDILILAYISQLSNQEKSFIIETYQREHRFTFLDKLGDYIDQESAFADNQNVQTNKLLAFSYSLRLDLSKHRFGDQIVQRSISNFKSEQELVKTLNSFYESRQHKVFILQAKFITDKEHISFIKFIIDKISDEMKGKYGQKSIVLLIHMQRNHNERNSSTIPLYQGWEQKIYYDLEGQFILDEEFLVTNIKDIIKNKPLPEFKQMLGTLTEACILKLQFEGEGQQQDQAEQINENLFFIMKKICIDDELVLAFKAKIDECLQQEKKVLDWREQICCNKDIFNDSINVETALRKLSEGMVEKYLTILLYQLESKTAFRSYFTEYDDRESETGQHIRDIWLYYFKNLNTKDMRLQVIPQSNYTTFCSNLNFPFSRTESEKLKEVIVLQKKFEAVNDSEGGDDKDIDHFAEQYTKISKLEPFFNVMIQDIDLQSLFMHDILKIFLIENLLSPRYQQIVRIILDKIMRDKVGNFYAKLYTFLMKQQLFYSICSILDLVQQLSSNKEEKLDQIEQAFKEALDQYDEASWEEMTAGILDDLILDCYPDCENIQHLQGLQNLAFVLEKLYTTMSSLDTGVKLHNLPILRFWSDLTQLCAAKGGVEEAFLVDRSTHAMKIQGECNFLINMDFVQKIFDHFEKRIDNNGNQRRILDDQTLRFVATYFSIIIDVSADALPIVAGRFEKVEYEGLFRHSSTIFSKIMLKSEILDTIDELSDAFVRMAQREENKNDDEEDDLVLDLPENDYIEQIEEVLEEVGLESNFAISISDYIVKENTRAGKNSSLLGEQIYLFKYYLALATDDKVENKNISHLIAHSMLNSYLDIYARTIVRLRRVEPDSDEDENVEDNNELRNAMEQIDQELTGDHSSKVKSTLQLYVLKKLKSFLNLSSSQFKNAMFDEYMDEYEWIKECPLLHQERDNAQAKSIDVYPYIQRFAQKQAQIQMSIESLIRSNSNAQKEQLRNRAQEIQTLDDKIQFGLAFFESCYLKFSKAGVNHSPHLMTFYTEELEQILEIKLGRPYTSFISWMIRNFPDNNIFQMQQNLDQASIYQRVLFCYIMIIILSYSKEDNPLSGSFMRNNGTFSIANINASFLMGQELEFKHFYIQDTIDNYQNYRNPNGSGTYICGQPCDYVYIVYNCGQQMVNSTCPWCRRPIGGQNHVMNPRPGHQLLPDANNQAMNYLNSLITKFEGLREAGYKVINSPTLDLIASANKLRPVTWRLLRLLVHVPMYFFMTVGGSNDAQFSQQIFNQDKIREIGKTTRTFLTDHINNDAKILFQQLSSAGNDCQPSWLYSVLGDLPRILDQFKGTLSTSYQICRQFENAIDQQLVQPKIANIGAVSQEFKELILRSQNENVQQMNTDMLLSELVLEEAVYPKLQFYRLTREFSFQDMQTAFNINQQNAVNFKVLKICLDNYELILKLRKFYPVIEFTSYLINRFNHLLKRDDAREIKMKDVFANEEDGGHIKELFLKFQKAWNNIGFEGNKIQYTCKEMRYQKYDEESDLINFLVDDKEVGGGMCMAAGIQELAQLQNKLLNQIIVAYSSQKQIDSKSLIDTYEYPVQRMKQNHIIDLEVDKYSILRSCSLNNIKYGQGQELFYAFNRIETNLLKDITQKKFVKTEGFEFIQYQLELMTSQGEKSALITEIRKRVPQSQFEKQDRVRIEQYFDQFEEASREEKATILRTLHGGLEKVLCFLHNSSIKDNITIEEFCRRIQGRIEKQYTDRSTLSQVRIRNIVALYEIIEKRYFPHITKNLRTEFFSEVNAEDIRGKMANILVNCRALPGEEQKPSRTPIPNRQQIQNAFLRFMIRCLAADLNPTHPISMYIVAREDLWDEEVLNEDNGLLLTNLEELMPVDICLADINCTYNIIDELNIQATKKSLAPSLGPKPQERQPLRKEAVGAPKKAKDTDQKKQARKKDKVIE